MREHPKKSYDIKINVNKTLNFGIVYLTLSIKTSDVAFIQNKRNIKMPKS